MERIPYKSAYDWAAAQPFGAVGVSGEDMQRIAEQIAFQNQKPIFGRRATSQPIVAPVPEKPLAEPTVANIAQAVRDTASHGSMPILGVTAPPVKRSNGRFMRGTGRVTGATKVVQPAPEEYAATADDIRAVLGGKSPVNGATMAAQPVPVVTQSGYELPSELNASVNGPMSPVRFNAQGSQPIVVPVTGNSPVLPQYDSDKVLSGQSIVAPNNELTRKAGAVLNAVIGAGASPANAADISKAVSQADAVTNAMNKLYGFQQQVYDSYNIGEQRNPYDSPEAVPFESSWYQDNLSEAERLAINKAARQMVRGEIPVNPDVVKVAQLNEAAEAPNIFLDPLTYVGTGGLTSKGLQKGVGKAVDKVLTPKVEQLPKVGSSKTYSPSKMGISKEYFDQAKAEMANAPRYKEIQRATVTRNGEVSTDYTQSAFGDTGKILQEKIAANQSEVASQLSGTGVREAVAETGKANVKAFDSIFKRLSSKDRETFIKEAQDGNLTGNSIMQKLADRIGVKREDLAQYAKEGKADKWSVERYVKNQKEHTVTDRQAANAKAVAEEEARNAPPEPYRTTTPTGRKDTRNYPAIPEHNNIVNPEGATKSQIKAALKHNTQNRSSDSPIEVPDVLQLPQKYAPGSHTRMKVVDKPEDRAFNLLTPKESDSATAAQIRGALYHDKSLHNNPGRTSYIMDEFNKLPGVSQEAIVKSIKTGESDIAKSVEQKIAQQQRFSKAYAPDALAEHSEQLDNIFSVLKPESKERFTDLIMHRNGEDASSIITQLDKIVTTWRDIAKATGQDSKWVSDNMYKLRWMKQSDMDKLTNQMAKSGNPKEISALLDYMHTKHRPYILLQLEKGRSLKDIVLGIKKHEHKLDARKALKSYYDKFKNISDRANKVDEVEEAIRSPQKTGIIKPKPSRKK